MAKKLNLVISEETRRSCKMLSAAYAHALTPISSADLNLLLSAHKINFSVWFYSADDEAYLEFITPLNFSRERVKKLIRLSEKYPGDFAVYVKESEADNLSRAVSQAQAKKFIDSVIYPALEGVWRKNVILTNIYTEIGESDALLLGQRLISGSIFSLLATMPAARQIFDDLNKSYPLFFENLVEEAFMTILFCYDMKISESLIKTITYAVITKDIGIYHLPQEIVEKKINNILSSKEYLQYMSHVERGVDILNLLNEKYKNKLPEEIIIVCRQHHELMNGAGYPNNLRGSQEVNGIRGIHMFTRIISIVEHYCSYYRICNNHSDTMRYMYQNACKFDETFLNKFDKIMSKYTNIQ